MLTARKVANGESSLVGMQPPETRIRHASKEIGGDRRSVQRAPAAASLHPSADADAAGLGNVAPSPSVAGMAKADSDAGDVACIVSYASLPDWVSGKLRTIFGVGALVALPTVVQAAPPPVGSDDYRLLMPYASSLNQARTRDGGLCCSVADGTVVDARIAVDHWQIKFLNNRFPDAPKGWIDVPPDAVNTMWFNPTGLPIAWWYSGAIRCFSPAGGV